MTYLHTSIIALALGATVHGSLSHAHHSLGMFDATPGAEIVVEGIVREWRFINPHSWLLVTVTEEDGSTRTWSFESGTVAQLLQRGIHKDTYRIGDAIRVLAGPMTDGRPGGMLKVVEHADGSHTLPIQTGDGQAALERWREAETNQ